MSTLPLTTLGLYAASAAKKIYNYSKNKKENLEYLKLDSEKYGEIDKPELEKIKNKVQEAENFGELAVVDIVTGYLKESNISFFPNRSSTSRDVISSSLAEQLHFAFFEVILYARNLHPT